MLVSIDKCLCFAWDDDDFLDSLVNRLKLQQHALDKQSIADNVYAFLGIKLNMQGEMVEMTQKETNREG